ncbi:MAG: hypothetical protein ACK4GJ_02180 [bacterium]
MPRKKQKMDNNENQNSKIKKNPKKEKDIKESIEDEEQNIELSKDDDEELNIYNLSDLDDLEKLEEEDYSEEDTDFFISEDDLIICPNCGEIIEIERLRLLEECPNCGLHISEFEEIEKYDQVFNEKEDEEW